MKYKFTITGIDCPNCAAKLASLMSDADGVASAKINFLTEKLIVESDLAPDALYEVLIKTAKSFSRTVEIEK